MLRGTEVSCVEHPPRQSYRITSLVERLHQLLKKGSLSADRQPFDVFEHKSPRVELSDDAYKLENEAVPGVIEYAVTDQREALTRRAAEHAIHSPRPDSGGFANICRRKPQHRLRDNSAVWEVKLVDGAMHGIDFNRGDHVEARLFESERHTAGAGKKINSNWTQEHLPKSLAEGYKER